jgi:hypothetical protein
MSKKQKPQVTTQQTVMDPMVTAAQRNLLESGQDILAPYLQSGTSGYGVAGFTPDQAAAFQGIRDRMAHGAGGMTAGDVEGWLNPYTRAVVDTTNQALRDESGRTLNDIRARTAAASSFGGSGSRGALLEARENEALDKAVAATTAQLMAQGYDRATATAQANHALQTSSLQALLGIGNQQQQHRQTELDVPLTALQRLAAITPQQYGSTVTKTEPPPQTPTPLESVLGLGMGLAKLPMGADSFLGKLFR